MNSNCLQSHWTWIPSLIFLSVPLLFTPTWETSPLPLMWGNFSERVWVTYYFWSQWVYLLVWAAHWICRDSPNGCSCSWVSWMGLCPNTWDPGTLLQLSPGAPGSTCSVCLARLFWNINSLPSSLPNQLWSFKFIPSPNSFLSSVSPTPTRQTHPPNKNSGFFTRHRLLRDLFPSALAPWAIS